MFNLFKRDSVKGGGVIVLLRHYQFVCGWGGGKPNVIKTYRVHTVPQIHTGNICWTPNMTKIFKYILILLGWQLFNYIYLQTFHDKEA